MKLVRSFFLLLFVLQGSFLFAQTADEIVSKHINAIGGKAIIDKIKSQVIQSDMSVMGSDLTSTTTLLVGKGFKNVANFNGQEIIQCITPTSGWMINPLAGQNDAQPLPDDQVKDAQGALEIGGELYEYQKKGSNVQLMGKETIEGVNTHKLKLIKKNGDEVIYFIDPTNYYIIKRESTSKVNGEELTTSSIFSNYKKTDFGYVMPFTTVANQGFEITITVKTVEFNKEVDPKMFEMPK